MAIFKMPTLVFLIGTLALVALVGTVAVTQLNAHDDKIDRVHMCELRDGHTVRIVERDDPCEAGETPIDVPEADPVERRLDQVELDITNIQDFALFDPSVMWIPTFHFLESPDGPPIPPKLVKISYRNSGLGAVITSPPNSGLENVRLALQVPPGYTVKDVRICYKLSNAFRSFINGIRIAQLNPTPNSAVVVLEAGTDLTSSNPDGVCVSTGRCKIIDPIVSPLFLSVKVKFGSSSDEIHIRGLGLHLEPKGMSVCDP